MSNLKKITQKRLFLPIFCMVLVLCINMVYDVASGNSFYNFFEISMTNGLLSGRIINILNRGSEVAILAIGMTLVVSASAGTDISVGSVMSLCASFCCMLVAGFGVSSVSSAEEFAMPLVVGLLVYYFLFYTSKGFQLRAVGLNMTAAEFNGFAVKKYILMSFIVSGAIAGLGGSAELLGTQFRLINGFGNGYGFDGVAMALIGQLHPLATILVAIFFAALRVGSTTMQAATGVPTSVSDIIQALVIVFTVAGLAMVKLPGFKAFLGRLTERRKEAA